MVIKSYKQSTALKSEWTMAKTAKIKEQINIVKIANIPKLIVIKKALLNLHNIFPLIEFCIHKENPELLSQQDFCIEVMRLCGIDKDALSEHEATETEKWIVASSAYRIAELKYELGMRQNSDEPHLTNEIRYKMLRNINEIMDTKDEVKKGNFMNGISRLVFDSKAMQDSLKIAAMEADDPIPVDLSALSVYSNAPSTE